MTFYTDLYAGVPGYKGKMTHANLMHTIIIIIIITTTIIIIIIIIQNFIHRLKKK